MDARKPLVVALGLTLATIAAAADDRPARSPDQDLPPHITRLTRFGERADFSHDGKRILFVEKTFGDAYDVDPETGAIRLLTGHDRHLGYTRALYLADGSILLSAPSGSTRRTPGRAGCSTSWRTETALRTRAAKDSPTRRTSQAS